MPLLGSTEVDTLDELLFQLANRRASDQPDLFNELIGTPGANDERASDAVVGIVWQYVSSMFYATGREIAAFQPGDKLHDFVIQYRGPQRPTLRRADPLPTFSLMLTNPNERLAMLPRSGLLAPEPTVNAIAAPWCARRRCSDRLAVLAEHPHSSAWANETIAVLQALTSDERPNAATAAVQLGTLDSLSEQALKLAEATDDDRLRAELLRAHWGLNRRLECWSLMRDIAVASAADNHFAARETLDSSNNVFAGQGTQRNDLRA